MQSIGASMSHSHVRPRKLIIDTDPGIDDSMAIASAFNSPEVDIIGLTSIFGNVHTPKATENCFFLLEMAGRPDVRAQHASLSKSAL